MTTLVVIAKEPVPGRVKTRLTPPYTPVQAAALAEAALADTLAAVAATPATRRVLALAGRPGRWLPRGFEVVRQRGTGLDERLANAFADAGGPAVLIGMDTPQVTPAALARAAGALDDADAVFGPAADGGWWLLGLRRPDPALLLGVPTSRPDTGAHQLARLRGLRVTTLPTLTDVDTATDAAHVAAQAPGSRFAAALRAVQGVYDVGPRPHGHGRGAQTPSNGSAAAAGSVPAGGSLAPRGSVAVGGSVAAGGSLATGGSVAAGGSLATGGSVATGGTITGGGAITVDGSVPQDRRTAADGRTAADEERATT